MAKEGVPQAFLNQRGWDQVIHVELLVDDHIVRLEGFREEQVFPLRLMAREHERLVVEAPKLHQRGVEGAVVFDGPNRIY